LKAFADKIDYELEMDRAELGDLLACGDPESRIAPIIIKHNPNITPFTPYEHSKWKILFYVKTINFLNFSFIFNF
jgi:hypothetical protein